MSGDCAVCGKPDSPFGYGPPGWSSEFWRCGMHRVEGPVAPPGGDIDSQWEVFLSEPLYETAEQAAAEAEIIAYVATKTGCNLYRKLPMKLGVDYAFMRNDARQSTPRITGMIEVKDRPDWTYAGLNAAGGYLISASKLYHAVGFCKFAGVKLSVAIRIAEKTEVWMAPVREEDIQTYGLTMFQGNNIPRREADKEPVFLMPMTLFKRI